MRGSKGYIGPQGMMGSTGAKGSQGLPGKSGEIVREWVSSLFCTLLLLAEDAALDN